MSSMRPSSSRCTRIVGRVLRQLEMLSAASISHLRALLTIRVHLELDGRTLDIVHCTFFTLKSQNFTDYDVSLNHLCEPSISFS